MTVPPGTGSLPQLAGRPMVTDGGMETDFIFHHDVDLPYFAAFPLLDRAHGRALLTEYYDDYAAIAQAAGAGLMLESPTWRANPDWAGLLGYSERRLADINEFAIEMLVDLRERYRPATADVVISGAVGPRGDGYRPDRLLGADEAAGYHSAQITAFARAGADMVTAYTLCDAGEAIGIVAAARAAQLPVAVSFTVETDGRLPSGAPLHEAIEEVDATAAPEYFLVNCAHPTHLEPALEVPGRWRERIVGIRSNASTRSHAELDDATELDEGDLELLASSHEHVSARLPRLAIVGGCCGTDARHVARLWDVDIPA